MSEVLRRLREEHKNIARLLRALEHQLAVFDRGEQPDYDVLLAIADYFTGFPDRCHHPKEDLIYSRLRQADPASADAIVVLGGEHEKIGALARQFREAVEGILNEIEMPRSAFDAVLRHFIHEQRHHMQMEELHFFPLAQKVLSKQDWAELDAQVTQEGDPLFGAEVSREFESLLQNILEWEREDEAQET